MEGSGARRGRKALGEDKKIALHVYTSPELREWLEGKAAEEERSVSFIVDKMLTKLMAVEAYKTQGE